MFDNPKKKLDKKLIDLEKEERASETLKFYHQTKQGETDNIDKKTEHSLQVDRLTRKLEFIRLEIKATKGQLAQLELEEKTNAYQREFTAFKRGMVEEFTSLLDLLKEGRYQDASECLDEIEAQYREGTRPLQTVDLKPITQYFSFVEIRRKLGIILDRAGQAKRLTTTEPSIVGGYQSKTEEYVQRVIGIIESTIDLLKVK